jgi:ankyrin repeat protein
MMRTVEQIYRQVETVPDFMGHTVSSVDYRNGYGDTPLHIVSGWGDCKAIEILAASGANLNAIGESGFTPLHCAAEQNSPEAVIQLLKLGAILTADTTGQSPLELAIILEHKEVIIAINENI